ncbi:hypothetical protein HY251_16275 [bacterium]|nr:hypothetical protein [bacterium]
MSDDQEDQGILKKVYFIKRAKPGEELTTLLKNKFKSIDAVRDLIAWFEEGRDFVVTLTDWTPPDHAHGKERRVAISPWIPQAENHKNLIDAIGSIIYWLDTGRDFDITLTPTDRFQANLN